MKRCLSSMYLAFSDDPVLSAMLSPLEESVCILMLTFLRLSASCRRFLTWSDSAAPALMAYSSASALLNAIVACVRLPKWIVDPMNLMTNPDVDFCVVAHPAQSESTKTLRFGVEPIVLTVGLT